MAAVVAVATAVANHRVVAQVVDSPELPRTLQRRHSAERVRVEVDSVGVPLQEVMVEVDSVEVLREVVTVIMVAATLLPTTMADRVVLRAVLQMLERVVSPALVPDLPEVVVTLVDQREDRLGLDLDRGQLVYREVTEEVTPKK